MTEAFALTLSLFVGAEILDVRELEAYSYGESGATEVYEVNVTERIRELGDAPFIHEADRFHHVHCYDDFYHRAYWLAERGWHERLYQAEAYRQYKQLYARLLEVTGHLEAAQNEQNYTPSRRIHLREARDLMDPTDWQRGIPP